MLGVGGGNHQAPSWSFGVCQGQHTHAQTEARGVISRLAGGAVRQLLAFQKRLAPGSTVNNELILYARVPRNTPHLFWNKQSYSRPTLR